MLFHSFHSLLISFISLRVRVVSNPSFLSFLSFLWGCVWPQILHFFHFFHFFQGAGDLKSFIFFIFFISFRIWVTSDLSFLSFLSFLSGYRLPQIFQIFHFFHFFQFTYGRVGMCVNTCKHHHKLWCSCLLAIGHIWQGFVLRKNIFSVFIIYPALSATIGGRDRMDGGRAFWMTFRFGKCHQNWWCWHWDAAGLNGLGISWKKKVYY